MFVYDEKYLSYLGGILVPQLFFTNGMRHL